VKGFFNKAWAAIKKGLGALWEVVKHVIVLAPPVAGSTGVSGQRALDLAQQRLRQLGVVDAVTIVGQIKRLSNADRERLAREIQDLVNNGSKLLEVVERSMSW
jgi:signal transduction histidine kinase